MGRVSDSHLVDTFKNPLTRRFYAYFVSKEVNIYPSCPAAGAACFPLIILALYMSIVGAYRMTCYHLQGVS